jgi:hypothetical protein
MATVASELEILLACIGEIKEPTINLKGVDPPLLPPHAVGIRSISKCCLLMSENPGLELFTRQSGRIYSILLKKNN